MRREKWTGGTARRRRVAGAARPTGSAHPERLERRVLFDSTVVFNEIMYHPVGDEAKLEWVELHNQQAVPMDLSGWSIGGGIQYTFPAGSILGGGAELVVASSPPDLQAASGYVGAYGPFTGHLSNGGEKLQLVDNSGRVMDSVSYGDDGDWPVAPDGSGVSLAKINPDTASGDPRNWSASTQTGGTPGAPNFPAGPPAAPALALNEVSPGDGGFVELANTTAATQSVGGIVLKRLGTTQDQFVLPSGSIAAGGFLSLTPAQLGFSPALGDRLFLETPGGTGVLDAVVVKTGLRGRSPDGIGPWLVPSQPTPGAANVVTLHDQVVIDEIMYDHQPRQGTAATAVTNELVPVNGQWTYSAAGADPGAGWQAPGFDDSSWASGRGVFYAGNVPGVVNGSLSPVAIPGLFGTGLSGPNQPLAPGALDSRFTVLSPGASSPTTAVVMSPNGAWVPDDSQSGWIGPVQSGGANLAAGDYVYTTTFSLDGYVPSTASLSLTLYADNQVTAVRLNGQPTGISGPDDGYRQAAGPFVINSGFVGGTNTLEFVVHNDGTSPNPAGFRAAISGTAVPVPKDTQLPLGPNAYYFRNTFNFTGDSTQTQLTLNALIDDGAVYYLNGVEVYRQNMPTGAVTYGTSATAVGTPTFGAPINLPTAALRQGTNVLAVEVHQAAGDATDAAMGAELLATQSTPSMPFTDSPEQWVELYNRGDQPVDLSGWKFKEAMTYAFPAGTTLGAHQYLVVSNDAASLQAEYPSARVLGNFSGKLSHSDDTIELVDAVGNPADQVHYYDSHPWPDAADGGGSSLELRDPNADNSKPEAWAASNESGKSSWKTYTYTAVASNRNGDPTQWNEFVLGLLDAGEVLLDDIHVVDVTGGGHVELLQNSTFDTNGAAAWRIIGNHSHSRVIVDPTNPANHVLDLIATGQTESMHNHAETTLVNNQPVVNGHTYQISFRAKWVSGSNLLNTRLYFDRSAQTTAIDVPQNNGTPGEPNTALVADMGPTYSGLAQSPIVPAAGQPVTVSVHIDPPNGVSTANLYFLVNGGVLNVVPMTPQGGDLFTGTIPGEPASAVVQFYVVATDSAGATSTYPAAGVNSRALYQVNDGVPLAAQTHTLRIIMTPADKALLYTNTNVMSNDVMGATIVYDNGEVFYDAGVKLHSSERGRDDDSRVSFTLHFPADHLFRGVHSSVVIDRSGQTGRNQDEIVMKQAIDHAGGVPGTYDDLVKVIAPRSQNTGTALLNLDPYSTRYWDDVSPHGGDGNVYKFELIYYPTQTTDGNPQSLKIPQNDNVIGVDLTNLGTSKEDYRYHYLLESHLDQDNFAPIMALTQTFDLNGSALDAATQQLLDVNEWMRTFALQSLGGIGDTYSWGYQHNLKFYSRPDGKMLVLPWDWDFTFVNSATSPLWGSGNIAKVIQLPNNKHLYLGNLQDIIATTFNPTYMSYWTSHYGSLVGQNYSGDLSYITTRSNYVLSQLPPQIPFSLTTNNGQPVTTNQPSISLSGKGWVKVKELKIEGRAEPLEVNWSGANVDTWTAAVPLLTGLNHLNVQAYDFEGKLIGSQAIDVTSTADVVTPANSLKVTELMFDPPAPPPGSAFTNNDDYEFIEFKNFGSAPINLSGVHFTDAIDFTFGDVTLNPGEVGVVVKNVAAFQSRYGTAIPILGSYESDTKRFANNGEHVGIADANGITIADFTYGVDPTTGWYPSTVGQGSSLVVVNPSGNSDLNDPKNWRPSRSFDGSPGVDETIPHVTGVLVGSLTLNNGGYVVPPGAVQSTPIAYANLDQIKIKFDQDVVVHAADLSLAGVNVPTYSFTGFSYDPMTFTATWILSGSIGDDRLRLDLSDAVTASSGGAALDGEWTDGTSMFPSGDNLAGGDFIFRFNVLPGDADGSGSVNFSDLLILAQHYGQPATSAAQGDFNGDAAVNFADLLVLAQHYGSALPAAPPQFAPALMTDPKRSRGQSRPRPLM